MTQSDRALAVCNALHNATQARSKGAQRTVGDKRLVMLEEPRLVLGSEGQPLGVEVWVELTIEGVVQDIDPHRIFINPPTCIVTAQEERDEAGNVTQPRQRVVDPVGALWEVLWQQVDAHPSPETKHKPHKGEGRSRRL